MKQRDNDKQNKDFMPLSSNKSIRTLGG